MSWTVFTHHRAIWMAVGIGAGIVCTWSVDSTAIWSFSFVLWFLGTFVGTGSPYRRVIYRESPLRRAVTGRTDLDERELLLRDRANGLAYYIAVMLVGFALMGLGMLGRYGMVALDAGMIVRLGLLSFPTLLQLPILMLEWFEPSRPAPREWEDA